VAPPCHRAKTFATPRAARRGGALVFVLVMLGVLVTLLAHLLAESRGAGGLAAAVLERERLVAAATDAVRRAAQRLADDDDLLVDHPGEPWADEEVLTDPAGITVRTRVADEGSRLDINNLSMDPGTERRRPPEDILQDLFLLCGDPDPRERIEALRDWVDADNDGRFEAAYYLGRKPPSTPSNKPLATETEWLHIAGFSPAWLADPSLGEAESNSLPRISDLVTAIPGPHGRTVPVNLNTASEALLTVLFGRGQEYLARAVITLREADPLRSADGLAALADPIRMTRLLPWLDLKSAWFRIESMAAGPRSRVRIVALAKREPDGTVKIVNWSR
jgi:type II secretory pathway component PulK